MLKTEMRNEATMHIDKMDTASMIKIINEENHNAVSAVEAASEQIEKVCDIVAECFEKGGRLFYVGAGTSGRLGVVDASECPPTFGVPTSQVIGVIAGGERCMTQAAEAAEDDAQAGMRDLQAHELNEKDVVVGISASGGAAYVVGALEYANQVGAVSVSVSSNPDTPIEKAARLAIVTDTGAEVVTGSTRMKSGTAQKLVLNMISTVSMIKTGKVYENMMINLKPSNKKLKKRMIDIVMEIKKCDGEEAEALLEQYNWNIRSAVENTGVGRKYPKEMQEYIDAETGVSVKKLTGNVGNSNHLYFTNNSFYDNDRKIVFCSDRTGKMNLFSLDLTDYSITQLTDLQTMQKANHMLEAIVDPIKNRCYFFYDKDLYAIDLMTLKSQVIYRMPEGYEPHIVSCKADADYVYTAIFEDVTEKVDKSIPENTTEFLHEKFKYVSDSKIVKVRFDGSGWEYIHEDACWIAHVNVNPKNEEQITFCHEGPWDAVDNRLFGMDVAQKKIWRMLPKNSKEVIGHEYWYEDGVRVGYHGTIRGSEDRLMSHITFDCSENVSTLFNFNTGHIFSFDEKLIVGDGDMEGRYIRLWKLKDGKYEEPRALCSHFSTFKTQNEHAHPRFTPDGKHVIFSSDRDGKTNIYIAEMPEYEELPLLSEFSKL